MSQFFAAMNDVNLGENALETSQGIMLRKHFLLNFHLHFKLPGEAVSSNAPINSCQKIHFETVPKALVNQGKNLPCNSCGKTTATPVVRPIQNSFVSYIKAFVFLMK